MQKKSGQHFVMAHGWKPGDVIKCTGTVGGLPYKVGDYLRLTGPMLRLKNLSRKVDRMPMGYEGEFIKVHCKLAKGIDELFYRKDGWGYGDRVRCVNKGDSSVFTAGQHYNVIGKGGEVFSVMNGAHFYSGIGAVFFQEF